MKSIKPLGSKILVAPLPKATYETDNKIQVQEKCDRGKVVEFSDEFEGIYQKGDVVLYSEGAGIQQYYKNQGCLWLNGNGQPQGDIWGIVTEEKDK